MLLEFATHDMHVIWSFDAQGNAISGYFVHDDGDIFVDDDSLSDFSAEY